MDLRSRQGVVTKNNFDFAADTKVPKSRVSQASQGGEDKGVPRFLAPEWKTGVPDQTRMYADVPTNSPSRRRNFEGMPMGRDPSAGKHFVKNSQAWWQK